MCRLLNVVEQTSFTLWREGAREGEIEEYRGIYKESGETQLAQDLSYLSYRLDSNAADAAVTPHNTTQQL